MMKGGFREGRRLVVVIGFFFFRGVSGWRVLVIWFADGISWALFGSREIAVLRE